MERKPKAYKRAQGQWAFHCPKCSNWPTVPLWVYPTVTEAFKSAERHAKCHGDGLAMRLIEPWLWPSALKWEVTCGDSR